MVTAPYFLELSYYELVVGYDAERVQLALSLYSFETNQNKGKTYLV